MRHLPFRMLRRKWINHSMNATHTGESHISKWVSPLKFYRTCSQCLFFLFSLKLPICLLPFPPPGIWATKSVSALTEELSRGTVNQSQDLGPREHVSKSTQWAAENHPSTRVFKLAYQCQCLATINDFQYNLRGKLAYISGSISASWRLMVVLRDEGLG